MPCMPWPGHETEQSWPDMYTWCKHVPLAADCNKSLTLHTGYAANLAYSPGEQTTELHGSAGPILKAAIEAVLSV